MNEEITASSILDTPTFVSAFKWHRNRKKGFRSVLFIAALCLPAIAMYSNGQRDFLILAAMVAFIAMAFVLARLWEESRLKKSIRLIPGYGEPVEWKLQAEGFDIHMGGSTGFTQWKHVFESVATPDGVLVYPQKNIFHWLPRTAFASESDYARFLQLIASKTQHSKVGLN